jgi:hypothetical protein
LEIFTLCHIILYSDFTLRKVKQTFGINTIEDQKFLPEIKPIATGATLTDFGV